MSEVTVDKLLKTYVGVRDRMDVRDKAHKEAQASDKEMLGKLEAMVKAHMKAVGLEQVKAAGITAFETTRDSVTIGDKSAFMTHIITEMLLNLQPHMYKDANMDWQPDGKQVLEEHIDNIMSVGAFDLLTLSANKTNCKTFMAGNDGVMPDGVSYRSEQVVQFRKGKAK